MCRPHTLRAVTGDPVRPSGRPIPASEVVAARMSLQRRAATAPELAVRSMLHARGWRFRVWFPVPGKPRRSIDVAFTRRKVAVFVDGCFWHGCPEHMTWPANNADWWKRKIERNVERDRDTDVHLAGQGWSVVRIWEHEASDVAIARIEAAIASRSA